MVSGGLRFRAINAYIVHLQPLPHCWKLGNYIVHYADDRTIYAVIPRPLLRPQVIEALNQNLATISSRCLKWHMRLDPKKTKTMVVSRSRTIATGYGGIALCVLSLKR